jgi:hypothetical protein
MECYILVMKKSWNSQWCRNPARRDNMIKVVEMAKYHQCHCTVDIAVIVDIWQTFSGQFDIDRRHGHS